MMLAGNPQWASKLTKRELVKYVEFLAVQMQGNGQATMQQRLVQELAHGNKNWADKMQTLELVQIAESIGQAEMASAGLGAAAGYGHAQSGKAFGFDDSLARAPGGFDGFATAGYSAARRPQTLQAMA